jgi:CDP-glucose 4,6-dehydratase
LGGLVLSASPLDELRRFYAGRPVLVTGHTGFKGAWLTLWLARLGARVTALALPPEGKADSLFERAGVAARCRSRFVDIRDRQTLGEALAAAAPSTVFHLAARARVQQGYADPVDTFAVNVVGTAALLDAARAEPAVEGVVCVTTDKVYRNHEWAWPYREGDELGGLDPYSASKAAAELVARAYAHTLQPRDRAMAVVTARGGNVVGGGDASPDRLVPDLVRALRSGEPLRLRNPAATRPWQHVLDLCWAYLLLGARLQGVGGSEPAWNFGPAPEAEITVAELVRRMLAVWGTPQHPVEHVPAPDHESETLRLDASQARRRLGWRPRLDAAETIEWTVDWHRREADGGDPAALVEAQIAAFERRLETP